MSSLKQRLFLPLPHTRWTSNTTFTLGLQRFFHLNWKLKLANWKTAHVVQKNPCRNEFSKKDRPQKFISPVILEMPLFFFFWRGRKYCYTWSLFHIWYGIWPNHMLNFSLPLKKLPFRKGKYFNPARLFGKNINKSLRYHKNCAQFARE